MKVKITTITLPLPSFGTERWWIGYTLQYKHHWWQRWRLIYDEKTHVPRLYESMSEVEKSIIKDCGIKIIEQ